MSPQLLDLRTASVEDSEEKGGNIGGTIGLVCLGVVGVVVLAIFVVKDSSLGGVASVAAANAPTTGDEMA
ncbi:unnamed protein product [Chondrus crispus]|uniref:Uncharacterized protein n=1 Tax=Chondrus crispus TaxID=2769 RepID=R7QMZ7_CHOCR|nr:unnamed protein product [Chondrus crispus]CDF39143.1 unnamed protein product [Chondrus crispus]|eukprot:XP_005719054.1 unnamed protein product [Chondrus crispus]